MMLCEQGIRIFTDHKNLLFTFHPLSVDPSIARNEMMKVTRWALFLSTFNYVIEHVDGDSNDFPDMLTPWLKGYRSYKSCICRVRKSFAYYGISSSPYRTDFIWPDRDSILNAQSKVHIHPNCTKHEGGVVRRTGKIWIPGANNDLKFRLLSVAHTGEVGHRVSNYTIDTLKSVFTWTGLAEEER